MEGDNIFFDTERNNYTSKCCAYALVEGKKFFIKHDFSTFEEAENFSTRYNRLGFSDFPTFKEFIEGCKEVALIAFSEKWYSIPDKIMSVSSDWGYTETYDGAYGGLYVNALINYLCQEYAPVWDVEEEEVIEFIEFNARDFFNQAVEDYLEAITSNEF